MAKMHVHLWRTRSFGADDEIIEETDGNWFDSQPDLGGGDGYHQFRVDLKALGPGKFLEIRIPDKLVKEMSTPPPVSMAVAQSPKAAIYELHIERKVRPIGVPEAMQVMIESNCEFLVQRFEMKRNLTDEEWNYLVSQAGKEDVEEPGTILDMRLEETNNDETCVIRRWSHP